MNYRINLLVLSSQQADEVFGEQIYFENLSVLNARGLAALLYGENSVFPDPLSSHIHPRSRAVGEFCA